MHHPFFFVVIMIFLQLKFYLFFCNFIYTYAFIVWKFNGTTMDGFTQIMEEILYIGQKNKMNEFFFEIKT